MFLELFRSPRTLINLKRLSSVEMYCYAKAEEIDRFTLQYQVDGNTYFEKFDDERAVKTRFTDVTALLERLK